MSSQHLSELVVALIDALNEGDVRKVADLAAQIEDETAPRSLLEEFETAIKQKRYEEAGGLLERLSERYEYHKIDESVRKRQASLIRDTAEATDEHREVADEYLGLTSGTQLARSTFLLTAGVFLADPDEHDEDELLTITTDLKGYEAELDRSASAIESITQEVMIPPTIAILFADTAGKHIAVDSGARFQVIIQNVGQDVARNVQLEVTSDDDLSVEPTREQINNLDVEAAVSLEFELRPRSTGEHQIQVILSSENAGRDSTTVSVLVREPHEIAGGSNGSRLPDIDDVPKSITIASVAGLSIGAAAYLKYLSTQKETQNDE